MSSSTLLTRKLIKLSRGTVEEEEEEEEDEISFGLVL
jgi:hypothetical protein